MARWVEQDGRCYYCLRVTWVPNVGGDFRPPIVAKSLKELRNLSATAEHLKRRCEGGQDSYRNIVMACYECNTERGERSVLDHVKFARCKHRPAVEVFTETLLDEKLLSARKSPPKFWRNSC